MSLRLATGFESTLLPAYGVDVTDTTGHATRWAQDLDAVRDTGTALVRYPVLWHRVEAEQGGYDWAQTDAVVEGLRQRGVEPVLDLVHHTSYPAWLAGGFGDPRFATAYLRYVEAFAHRYPSTTAYTLFNEPFATLFLSGHEALWPPYGRGARGLVPLLRAVLPALAEASRLCADLLPGAQHVWVDTCEAHAGTPGPPAEHAALANDRRFAALDLFLGRDLDPARPFLAELVAAGGEDLLGITPGRLDVLGLDYYAHSEWYYDDAGAQVPSPQPRGLAALAEEYAGRYGVPVALTETNLRGFPSDRASWLRHTLEQCELARSRGVDLRWYCWFPFVDSCDWDSLLARPAGRLDPVGLLSLSADRERQRTSLTRAWELAAAGAPATQLPAYRLQEPAATRLAGLAPLMAHWTWQDPPAEELVAPVQVGRGAA